MNIKRLVLVLLALLIVSSACSVQSTEKQVYINGERSIEKVIIVSDESMEYLEQDPDKWLLYDEGFDPEKPNFDNLPWDAEQWMQGSWHEILTVPAGELDKELGYPVNVGDMADANWVYYLEHPYTWNNLEFPESQKTLIKGVNMDILGSSWLPSIYRQFFTLEYASSATLTVWVIGDVDVYMDPPYGTRLLSDHGPKPRSFLGRGKGNKNMPTKITISIPKVSSGTHCLYFVHKAAALAEQFCMMHTLTATPFASQTTDGGWVVDKCDCSCLASNADAEYLVHGAYMCSDDNTNKIWEPQGHEYVLGKWAPVSIIPYYDADTKAWGRDFRGTPWQTLYNKCANWIYTVSDPMDGWNNCRAWETNVYRHSFSVDKDCNANLIMYTNDLVDIYVDPFIDLIKPSDSTYICNNPQPNDPYYVGRAIKMKGGKLLTIPIFLTKGTHTLYFVHKNDPPSLHDMYDYYGLIYTLCCKEECECDD
ncbi:MAG TPA: hypothetical protein PKV16_02800 [Caldisericia bacterium]|nr:hypothetical protein [Caldisericia bacterium]HPF48241.1 hypothetical protein [Caldisericia bacterium]HPI83823.1 hypothetical protein [Caldisericia bacterium]HPQ92694.1 hypothetical protein [Caldisericia bacterium]HRV74208.1 hypothetical protein [Caldisericia bacterium]